MKILFVYPRFIKYLESFDGRAFDGFDRIGGYSYPPALGLSVLMSLTDQRHEFIFQDENIEPIDFDTDADVVAVSFFTPQAGFAYAICAEFRRRNKLVVIGGMHPTVFFDEAQRHADIVCVGEGERAWIQILEDIEHQTWRHVYREESHTDLNAMPVPNRAPYYANTGRYNILIDYLELTRGCNAECDSCVVPLVSGRDLRFKNIDTVLADVRTLQYPMCFLTDDIVFMQGDRAGKQYLIDVFREIGNSGYARNHGFYISSTAVFPPDPDLMAAMCHGGATVSYFTFGFDPMSNAVMTGGQRRHTDKVVDQVKRLQDAGILFYAAFHLGFDDHSVAIKDNILEFCRRAGITLAQFCLRVPWPGTIMWKQLEREHRILHTDWNRYNGSHVVFAPKAMTADQLQLILIELWQEFAFNFHRVYELQRTQVIRFGSLR
jgi:radical SAM superfamily enzyme YgiQ (UPF0313 family)